jgi:hypothetical protein
LLPLLIVIPEKQWARLTLVPVLRRLSVPTIEAPILWVLELTIRCSSALLKGLAVPQSMGALFGPEI